MKNILLTLVSLLAVNTYADREATYEIEIYNNTPSQWFSPCLCALHKKRLNLFDLDQAATAGQAVFSEDGFNGIWAEELRANDNVYSVLQCDAGLTPPDATRVETITGPRHAQLTCAAMPVTTNDVLTTVTVDNLPKFLGSSRSYNSIEWNLGTEEDAYSATTMPEDSLDLIPEGPGNPVFISDNVNFGAGGRPEGVPSLLSPFTRQYFDANGVTAEGTMMIFDTYVGSEAFPAELYGWPDYASKVTVTRIK